MKPSMSERARIWYGAAVLFVAPVVLLAGILSHPFVRNYMETDVVGGAVSGSSDRWVASHVMEATGIALLLLAVTVLRQRFRGVGEQRWSAVAMSLLIVGGTLLGAVVGSELTLAAVVKSGADVHSVLEAGETATLPLYLGGVLLYALGWLSFAVAFYRAPILPSPQNWGAIVALVLIPIGLSVPQTSGHYLHGAGVLVVTWLVGYRMIAEGSAASAARDLSTRKAT